MTRKEKFTKWTDFLQAYRDDRLVWEEDAAARVVYDSSYSDEPQVLSGLVDRVWDSLGKQFALDGKRVEGFHVYSNGRKIGRVKEIEFEVRD